MRLRSALLLAALIGPAVAQTSTSEPTALTGSLAVFLKADNAAPSLVLRALKREVDAAVVPSGIHLVWNSAPDSEVYTRVAVMTLRGVCSAQTPAPAIPALDRESEPLGQTYVVDGKVLPFADVRCDSVRKVIDSELRASPAADREELLGRALGRVMAHELYHVLLRTTRHGRSGLARPALTSSDLLAIRESFASSDEQKLSNALCDDSAGCGSPDSSLR